MTENELARLREAFSHRCVTAWLGYADVLFLGFGDDIVPRGSLEKRGPHPRSPFKLVTNCIWRVQGPICADSSLDGSRTIDAAESLVGERVLSWQLVERLGLRLAFSGGKTLVLEPFPSSYEMSYAWSLTGADGLILGVSGDGRSAIVPGDMPILNWFS